MSEKAWSKGKRKAEPKLATVMKRDIGKLHGIVDRMPTDVLLAFWAISDRAVSSRLSCFFDDPDKLRREVGDWDDVALRTVTEVLETSIAQHRWEPEREAVAELERVLLAELLTRNLEVEVEDENDG